MCWGRIARTCISKPHLPEATARREVFCWLSYSREACEAWYISVVLCTVKTAGKSHSGMGRLCGSPRWNIPLKRLITTGLLPVAVPVSTGSTNCRLVRGHCMCLGLIPEAKTSMRKPAPWSKDAEWDNGISTSPQEPLKSCNARMSGWTPSCLHCNFGNCLRKSHCRKGFVEIRINVKQSAWTDRVETLWCRPNFNNRSGDVRRRPALAPSAPADAGTRGALATMKPPREAGNSGSWRAWVALLE